MGDERPLSNRGAYDAAMEICGWLQEVRDELRDLNDDENLVYQGALQLVSVFVANGELNPFDHPRTAQQLINLVRLSALTLYTTREELRNGVGRELIDPRPTGETEEREGGEVVDKRDPAWGYPPGEVDVIDLSKPPEPPDGTD